MRFSLGILASAAVIFTAGAFGVLGTWALAAATVLGLVGAVCTAIVMEERDQSQAVVTALADRRRPLVIDPMAEGTLDLLGH